MQTHYQKTIARLLEDHRCAAFDPRHIEGYMRLGHSTLGALSAREFEMEIVVSMKCIIADGIQTAENNAQSFGL